MMLDDRDGVEMGPIGRRVSIAGNDDFEVETQRRPDGCVDAEIGGASGDDQPPAAVLLQSVLKIGLVERVTGPLANHFVIGRTL